MTNETPAQTRARIPEIAKRNEARTKGEWPTHYRGPIVASDPTDIPALLALVAWQQEVIRDASSEIDHLELCGGVGRKSLNALRERIQEATG